MTVVDALVDTLVKEFQDVWLSVAVDDQHDGYRVRAIRRKTGRYATSAVITWESLRALDLERAVGLFHEAAKQAVAALG